MVLIDRLRRWAVARPGVLIVDAPGTERLRWSVQAEIDRRGWQLAPSPADASVMLTVGILPASLAAAADLLWSQMPQPRVRRMIEVGELGPQLDAAIAALVTPSAYEANAMDAATQLSSKQDADAASGQDMGGHDMGMGGHDMSGHDMGGHDMGGQDMDMASKDVGEHSGHDTGGQDMGMAGHDMDMASKDMGEHSGHDMGGQDMGGHDMGGHDMGGQDMGGHDMGGHDMGGQDMGGHDMGGHDMGGQDMGGHDMGGHMHHGGDVAGLPMAGTAPDRDGLQLDRLAVTLGPVLQGWPTGLVLRASMQGDVLTEVSLSWGDGIDIEPGTAPLDPSPEAVALDALAGFLLVAGWPLLAGQARSAQWAVLSDDAAERDRGRAAAAKVARKVLRSRFLAWSVRGIGDQAGSTGDVLARVRALATVAAGEGSVIDRTSPEHLESLLEGAELAAARLIVASFVIQPAVVALPSGHRHG